MSKDYRRSTTKPNMIKNSGGFVWLLAGVLVGLIIAGIFYLKNHQVTIPLLPIKPLQPMTTPAAPLPSKKQADKQLQTQFDFYQVLPDRKVTSTISSDNTTSTPPMVSSDHANETATATDSTDIGGADLSTASTVANTTPSDKTTNSKKSAPTTVDTGTNTDISTKINTVVATKSHPKITLPLMTKSTVNTLSALTKSKTDFSNKMPAAPNNYYIRIGVFKDFNNADQLKAQLILAGFQAHIIALSAKGANLQQVWIGPYRSLAAAKIAQDQLPTPFKPGKVLQNS